MVTSVFHMLELAVEADHDQHQPQGTLLEMVGTEEEARGLCAPQYGSRNVWKYSPTQHMEEANVNVQQYVAEVRAATEAEDAAQENNGGVSLPKGDQTARARTQQLVSDGNCDVLRIHQLSESERATEMNISMRLQAEAAEEENAINACTSPLQVSSASSVFPAGCRVTRSVSSCCSTTWHIVLSFADASRALPSSTGFWVAFGPDGVSCERS